MRQKKQIIRLTEQDLHNIIMESVNKVVRKRRINEIGDTKRGKYMLGRLAARNNSELFTRRRQELDNEINKRIKPYNRDDEVNRDFYDGYTSYGSTSPSYQEDEYRAKKFEDFDILFKQFRWYVLHHDETKRIVHKFITDYLNDEYGNLDVRPIYKLIDRFESDYDLSVTEEQEDYFIEHIEQMIDDYNCGR